MFLLQMGFQGNDEQMVELLKSATVFKLNKQEKISLVSRLIRSGPQTHFNYCSVMWLDG